MNKYYELTIPQKSIWYTDQYYKDTSITNVSGTGIINEKLNIELLKKAINLVDKNNDALRIRIVMQGDTPMQYFEDYKEFDIECVNVKNEEESTEYVKELASEHIELLNNKLVKFTIFQFPDKTGGFNIVGSHITADAWGSAQVCSEVVNTYSKLKNNNMEDMHESSYIDYLEAEKEYLDSDKFIKDKEYWENQFSTVPESVAHIVPHNEESDAKIEAIRKEIKLGNDLTEKVNEYCKANRISPFVFFFGIYAIYLSFVNGNEDIVIGTPMLNRKGVKEKAIIGMFVNSLPFKINVNENKSIADLFKGVSETSMQMLRHQKYSYMDLLKTIREKLKVNNDLYDVVLSYQNAKTTANDSDIDYKAKWNFNGNISETINIHISDIDSENNYCLYYDYQKNRLTDNDILEIHNRIINIINQIIKIDNMTAIKNISILTSDELNKIDQFNKTGDIQLEEKVLPTYFEKIVSNYPNNVALKYKDQEMTYSELNNKVNCLAKKLREEGVTRNTPVAIILDKSFDAIIAILGILKAGGCYVPILPDEQTDRLNYIINDCNPVLVITHKNYEKLVENRKFLNLDNMDYSQSVTVETISEPDDIAYMIYTSGTTGNPKGVQVMHKNVCSLRASMENDDVLRPTESDVSMSLLKYSFDASGIDIYSALLSGGKLVLVDKQDELNPKKVIQIIESEGVTRSFLIPKWLEHINTEDIELNANLSTLKILGTGGEILKPELVKSLYSKYKNLRILNLYGPTETTMFTTYKILDLENINSNNATIGKPISGSRAFVINKQNQVLPAGMSGELCVYEDDNSIENIAKGYLNKPEETNKKFTMIYNPISKKMVHAYKTGDIVKINRNMEFEFHGRRDDIVKVNGGYLIALNEVEKRITTILDEKYNVSAFAIPFNNTKAIVVFVSKKDKNEEKTINNLYEYINSKLTFYMHPRKVIELDEFPRNNSGKIDKKVLRQVATEALEKKSEIVLPTTNTEKFIYNVIKQYASSKEISITDDFMQDLGIDSLTIASIYSKLEEFGISLQDIYTYTNIKELANFIDTGKENIKKILEENVEIENDVKKFDMSNILLTGATGFLGAHVLYELLKNDSVNKIYCIIRSKSDRTSQMRFGDNIEYYFKNDSSIVEPIKNKIIVLDGDTTKPQFNLSNHIYNELLNNVTTVINCAANVRHYGKEESINSINVNSVKSLLSFCFNSGSSLAHMSTLSIAGFRTEESAKHTFDEDSLYVGQNLNSNPYLISKYTAETLILKEKSVNSKIFRLGNIMPREIDGKFQKNYNQNAYMNALKIIWNLKEVPQEYLDITMEFSPVDECAKSIVKILSSDDSRKILHIVNDKLLSVRELIRFMSLIGYTINTISAPEFIEKLNDYSGIGKFYIKEYIIKNKVNQYESIKTTNQLANYGFAWKNIDQDYITKVLNIIEKNGWYDE